MLFSKNVAILAVLVPFASAHNSIALPKILGLDSLDRKAESLINSLETRGLVGNDGDSRPALEGRKDAPECGEGIGTCSQDKCCSISGFCGTSPDHCYSPNCNWKYGPACPENQHPDGANTSSIPRPKLGSILYGGSGISKCKVPGTVALTYDDGPQKDFTDHILDLLKSYNAKATFFITGNNINKGQIDKTQEHINTIKRMNTEGHQLASHTWTHLDLSKISSEDRKKQIWNVEMALNNIVGKIPTYLRPPYSSCDASCQQDMSDLGYHLVSYDITTEDYRQMSASEIQNSKDWFKGNITKNGATSKTNDWLVISHDTLEQTAKNLTEYMLSTLTQLGYRAVTVGECLGDPEENWYRKFGDSENRTGNTLISESTTSSQSRPSASVGTPSTTSPSDLSQKPSSTSTGGAPEQIASFASRTLIGVGYLPYTIMILLLTLSATYVL